LPASVEWILRSVPCAGNRRATKRAESATNRYQTLIDRADRGGRWWTSPREVRRRRGGVPSAPGAFAAPFRWLNRLAHRDPAATTGCLAGFPRRFRRDAAGLPRPDPLRTGLWCRAQAAGADALAAFGLSTIIFSGAAQILALQLYAAGAPLAIVVLTCFVLGLRLLMYSAAMAPHLASLSPRWQRGLAFLLTDQAFARRSDASTRRTTRGRARTTSSAAGWRCGPRGSRPTSPATSPAT